jgi:hypothetical protein
MGLPNRWLVCIVTGLMAGGMSMPPRIVAADNSYAEVERYAFTLLHFQRMLQLQEPGVQQALRLSNAQVQTFRKEGAEAKRMLSALQTAPASDRQATVEKQFVPKAEKYQQLIDEELSDQQEALLFRKVVRAQRGAIALVLPGVPEHLEMTSKQRDAVSKIVDTNRKAMQSESFSNSPLELIKLSRRATASRQAAESVLSAEQKSRWAELLR